MSAREDLINRLYAKAQEVGLTSGPTTWAPTLIKKAGRPPFRTFGISIPAVLDGAVKVYGATPPFIQVVWSYRRQPDAALFRDEPSCIAWMEGGGWTGISYTEEEE